MKLMFNGILEKVSGGCVPCGAKRSSNLVMKTKKRYILPSGLVKTFYVGRIEEVSDPDGEFLMTYKYTDKDGTVNTVFTEVK